MAHPWPVLAGPSERWPLMPPTAPPPHPLCSLCSEYAASQAGLPCFGALCCRSTPLVCTPADTDARRIVCLDASASVL